MRRSEDGGLVQVAPDGRHLAFEATARRTRRRGKWWALENFLQPATGCERSDKSSCAITLSD
jgi:hypothetical protein